MTPTASAPQGAHAATVPARGWGEDTARSQWLAPTRNGTYCTGPLRGSCLVGVASTCPGSGCRPS